MRRFEQEREQKEERERQKRLTRMNSSMNSLTRIPPTPSPHSTDDLLPTLEEGKQANIIHVYLVVYCFKDGRMF